MALLPIKDLGKGGVIKDTSPALLPENVMTDALNVRFRNGSVETIKGESVLFSAAGVTPEYGIHWRRPDMSYSVLLKDGVGYAKRADGVEFVVLNQAGALWTDSKWQIDHFGGGYAIFINNNMATPRYALYQDPMADMGFEEFPGWNYIVGTTITAKVIKPFGYSLVAANLTFDDGSDTIAAPVTIRISVQAAIGGFPSVWQPGLTTDTADEFEVNSRSAILDMAELRGNMMIYSYTDIHMLSINNGFAVVRPYAKDRGILAQNCVVEFDGNHFVVDTNDIYVHNGSGQTKSVAAGRVQDVFFTELDPVYSMNVFVQKNTKFKEIWVCYPTTAATAGKCNKAMIWNYAEDTWTFRTLPDSISMFVSPVLSGGAFKYASGDTILSCQGSARVLLMDSTYQMVDSAGTAAAFSSYIVREKFFSGNPFGDNFISGIAPILQTSNAAHAVNITVTTQNVFDKAADFSNTSGRDLYTITPQSESQGYKFDARQTGRFLNYKIAASVYWKLSFLGIDPKPAGRR